MEPYAYAIKCILSLRRFILHILGAMVAGTTGFYFVTPFLVSRFQRDFAQKLVFYTVAEPFLSQVKLALALTCFTLMPGFLFFLWRAFTRPFQLSHGTTLAFAFFTTLLFYAGAIFCYAVTLPYGIKFLLGFESEHLKPLISIGKFVSFVTVFILAFGVIFELPVFMIFMAKVGLVGRRSFENNRRYAVLAISIVSALLTPTPDIFNMLLMGGPLYILYEAGILAIRALKL